jgi:hypothetical protein
MLHHPVWQPTNLDNHGNQPGRIHALDIGQYGIILTCLYVQQNIMPIIATISRIRSL